MVSSVTSIMDSLGKLVRGVGLNNLSGPVGIFQITAQTTQDGLLSTLALIAFLSVKVGIVNLIPSPILDGGRIFIILIETLIGLSLIHISIGNCLTDGILSDAVFRLFRYGQ